MPIYGKNLVPPKFKDFVCPICDSKEYYQVKGSNKIIGHGGVTWLKYNVCKGCGVHFDNAEQFTKARKKA